MPHSVIPNTLNNHKQALYSLISPFLALMGVFVFWRKGGRFGSILYLTSTYSIQSMHPSAQRKPQLKFRYEIQYTNEISDNDFFQLRTQGEGGTSMAGRMDRGGMEEEGGSAEGWRAKTARKKVGKEQPVILLQGISPEENNAVKMEQSDHSFQKALEAQDSFKTPLNQAISKGSASRGTPCPQTTIPRERKGSEQYQVKCRGSRKGLAWISSYILDLLQGEYRSENRFTCGQISQKVLTDFYSSSGSRENWSEGGLEEKEKKTIRRRVYDSINVLIALGKIKKYQKYLFVQSIDRRIGEEILMAKREKLAACRQEAQRKQAILDRARNEYGKLMQLKARNEQLSESKQQGYSGTFSTFSPGHTIYRFPLLIAYGEPHSKMQVDADFNSGQEPQSKDQIIISSHPHLYLLSDLAALQYLHFRPEHRPKQPRARREK